MERTNDGHTPHSMDELQKLSERESDAKVHLLTVRSRLYEGCRKGARSSRDRKWMSGCLWLGRSWELLQMGTVDLFEMMEIL